MKLEKLVLERYGAFTDRTLAFDPNATLHVVLGPNEAGKTSALHAIYDLLFGFGKTTPFGFEHDQKLLRVGGTFRGADDTLLSARRRKGNKDTLLDAQDRPLSDDLLANLLGTVSRETFCSEFGLTADAMRNGGEELLRAGGKLAETLAAGSAGMSSLTRQRTIVAQEAENLFDTRRSAAREFYTHLDDYTATDKRLKDSIITADAVEAAKTAVDTATVRHEELLASHEQNGRELARLQRVQRAREQLLRIDELRRSLAELSDLPDVADETVATWKETLSRIAKAQGELERFAQEDEADQDSIAKLNIDEAVLASAASIEALTRRIGEIRKEADDLPRRKAAHRAAEDQLSELARRLELSSHKDLLARLPSDLALTDARQIIKSATQASDLVQRCEITCEAARRDLARLEEDPAASVHVTDPAQLRQQLSVFEQVPALCERARHEDTACKTEQDELDTAIARLDPRFADPAQVSVLPLPDGATVAAHEVAATNAERALANASMRLNESRDAVSATTREVQRLSAAGSTVTQADMAAARHRRDAAVDHLDGALHSPQQAALCLKDVRHHIMATDQMADRLVANSGQAAQLEGAREKLADAERAHQRASDTFVTAEADQREASDAWTALWQRCEISPRNPSDMQKWLARVADLREKMARLAKRRTEQAALLQQIGDLRAPLTKLLASFSVPAQNDHPVELLYREAGSRLLELQDNWNASRTRVTELKRARRDVDDAVEALDRATRDAATKAAALPEALVRIGLTATSNIAIAEKALEVWQSVGGPRAQLEIESRRVVAIEADMETYRKDVDALVMKVAPSLQGQAPHDAVTTLAQQLEAARRAEASRAHLYDAAVSRNAKRHACQLAKDADDSKIAEVRRQLSLAPDAYLPDALHRLTRRNEVIRLEAQAIADLLRVSDGFKEAELRADVAAIDPDASPAEIERINADQHRLLNDIGHAFTAISEARQTLDGLKLGRDAAGAAQSRTEAVAKLQSVVERWLVRASAAKLAARAIERHRAMVQDPLLGRAGEFFATATAGAFERLAVAYGNNDMPSVVAVRSGGGQVEVSGLSEGTRDQLFLSLRLALLERRRAEPLPFIGDDLLASFDELRTQSTLELLASVGRTRQVILFTHHQHVADLARKIPGNAAAVIELQPARTRELQLHL